MRGHGSLQAMLGISRPMPKRKRDDEDAYAEGDANRAARVVTPAHHAQAAAGSGSKPPKWQQQKTRGRRASSASASSASAASQQPAWDWVNNRRAQTSCSTGTPTGGAVHTPSSSKQQVQHIHGGISSTGAALPAAPAVKSSSSPRSPSSSRAVRSPTSNKKAWSSSSAHCVQIECRVVGGRHRGPEAEACTQRLLAAAATGGAGKDASSSGGELQLRREPTNLYDANAIQVVWCKHMREVSITGDPKPIDDGSSDPASSTVLLGYLPSKLSEHLASLMDEAAVCITVQALQQQQALAQSTSPQAVPSDQLRDVACTPAKEQQHGLCPFNLQIPTTAQQQRQQQQHMTDVVCQLDLAAVKAANLQSGGSGQPEGKTSADGFISKAATETTAQPALQGSMQPARSLSGGTTAATFALELHCKLQPLLFNAAHKLQHVQEQLAAAKAAAAAGLSTGRVLRDKFVFMIDELKKLDAHLFTDQELHMMSTMRELAAPRLSLLLRLFLRRGPWFILRDIEYREVPNAEQCGMVLVAAGLLSQPVRGDCHALLDMLPAHTAWEVAQRMGVSGISSGSRKAELVSALLTTCSCTLNASQRCLRRSTSLDRRSSSTGGASGLLGTLSLEPKRSSAVVSSQVWQGYDGTAQGKARKPVDADHKPIEADHKCIEADHKPSEADQKCIEADRKHVEADHKCMEADHQDAGMRHPPHKSTCDIGDVIPCIPLLAESKGKANSSEVAAELNKAPVGLHLGHVGGQHEGTTGQGCTSAGCIGSVAACVSQTQAAETWDLCGAVHQEHDALEDMCVTLRAAVVVAGLNAADVGTARMGNSTASMGVLMHESPFKAAAAQLALDTDMLGAQTAVQNASLKQTEHATAGDSKNAHARAGDDELVQAGKPIVSDSGHWLFDLTAEQPQAVFITAAAAAAVDGGANQHQPADPSPAMRWHQSNLQHKACLGRTQEPGLAAAAAAAAPVASAAVSGQLPMAPSAECKGCGLQQRVQELVGPCVRVACQLCSLIQRMQRVYLLNETQDLSRWVVAEQGVTPYPPYTINRTRSAFPTRQALLDYEQALQHARRLDDALMANDMTAAQAVLAPAWSALHNRELERVVWTSESPGDMDAIASSDQEVICLDGVEPDIMVQGNRKLGAKERARESAAGLVDLTACTKDVTKAEGAQQDLVQQDDPHAAKGCVANTGMAGMAAGSSAGDCISDDADCLAPGSRHAVSSSDPAAATAVQQQQGPPPLFLARFCAAWVYAGMCTVGVSLHEKARDYEAAVKSLRALLKGNCCPGRRGEWWLRLSIDLEHLGRDEEALQAAEQALADPWVKHGDLLALKRRVVRLGRPPRRWKKPAWAAAIAVEPPEVVIMGRPLNNVTGIKSRFYAVGGAQVSVEQLALEHYASAAGGGWHGMHCEGGVWACLVGLLIWDCLFHAGIPDVFRTPFQTAPLDLDTDAFYPARRAQIDRLLQRIATGEAEQMLAVCWAAHHGRWCRGVSWDRYSLEQLQEIARCVGGLGLSAVCRMLAEDYAGWRGGMPDLLLWRPEQRDAKLAEVKGPRDRLSDAQRAWMAALSAVGLHCEVLRVQEPK